MDDSQLIEVFSSLKNEITKQSARTEILFEEIKKDIKVFGDGLDVTNRNIEEIKNENKSINNRLERIEEKVLFHDKKISKFG